MGQNDTFSVPKGPLGMRVLNKSNVKFKILDFYEIKVVFGHSGTSFDNFWSFLQKDIYLVNTYTPEPNVSISGENREI